MATYAELKVRFAAILNRDDLTDTNTDGFFLDAIDVLNDILRVEEMRKEAQPVFTAGVAPLPADYLQTEYIFKGEEELVRKPIDKFLKLNAGSTTKFYLRRGSNLHVKAPPADTETVDLYYFGRIPAFTDDADTTEIAGAIFVYGALAFAADHFIDERAAVFENRFKQLVTAANAKLVTTEMSEGPADVSPVYDDLEY